MTTLDFGTLRDRLQNQAMVPVLSREQGPGYILPNASQLLHAVNLAAIEEMRDLGLGALPTPVSALIPSGINDPLYAKIYRALELASANNAFSSDLFAPGIRVLLANHTDWQTTSINDIPLGTLGTIDSLYDEEESGGFQPAWMVDFDNGESYWCPEYNLELTR
jgi:hypothetical protein